MPRTVVCPRCSSTLRAPAGSTDEFLTCPRCLAEVPAPATDAIQTTVPERAEPDATCDECGEPVGRDWRYCPKCQEPLWVQRRRGRSVVADVRRDNVWIQVPMALLATLGGIGVVLMLYMGLGVAASGEFTTLGIVLATLFAIGLGSALTVVVGGRARGAGQAMGLIAYRSLAVAGVVVFVSLLTCTAGCIYLFVVCIQGGFH
jgi:DNA-directed RNA polymerase subunit M/transcription elongation factor TFIIS